MGDEICGQRSRWTSRRAATAHVGEPGLQAMFGWIDNSSTRVHVFPHAIAVARLRVAVGNASFDLTADFASAAKQIQKSSARHMDDGNGNGSTDGRTLAMMMLAMFIVLLILMC